MNNFFSYLKNEWCKKSKNTIAKFTETQGFSFNTHLFNKTDFTCNNRFDLWIHVSVPESSRPNIHFRLFVEEIQISNFNIFPRCNRGKLNERQVSCRFHVGVACRQLQSPIIIFEWDHKKNTLQPINTLWAYHEPRVQLIWHKWQYKTTNIYEFTSSMYTWWLLYQHSWLF